MELANLLLVNGMSYVIRLRCIISDYVYNIYQPTICEKLNTILFTKTTWTESPKPLKAAGQVYTSYYFNFNFVLYIVSVGTYVTDMQIVSKIIKPSFIFTTLIEGREKNMQNAVVGLVHKQYKYLVGHGRDARKYKKLRQATLYQFPRSATRNNSVENSKIRPFFRNRF